MERAEHSQILLHFILNNLVGCFIAYLDTSGS